MVQCGLVQFSYIYCLSLQLRKGRSGSTTSRRRRKATTVCVCGVVWWCASRRVVTCSELGTTSDPASRSRQPCLETYTFLNLREQVLETGAVISTNLKARKNDGRHTNRIPQHTRHTMKPSLSIATALEARRAFLCFFLDCWSRVTYDPALLG